MTVWKYFWHIIPHNASTHKIVLGSMHNMIMPWCKITRQLLQQCYHHLPCPRHVAIRKHERNGNHRDGTLFNIHRFFPQIKQHSNQRFSLCDNMNFDERDAFNSLWPCGVIWRKGSRSTLAQVMAWCLTAATHYLNQCWLMISEMLWHPPDSNFIPSPQGIYCLNEFETY